MKEKTKTFHLATILSLYKNKYVPGGGNIGECITLAYHISGKKYFSSELYKASLDCYEVLSNQLPWLNEYRPGAGIGDYKKSLNELIEKYGEFHEVYTCEEKNGK